MSEGRINRFYTKLYELKDWPDRDIIVALSNIAKEDITTAPSLAQLVVQRLLDPSTNSTYRRPLFYLIDSLMKSVGGPYASIFENHLMDVYTMTLKDIHNPEDIKKLDFLFKTWGERNFFSGNLLSKMRYQLSQPQVVSILKLISVMIVNSNLLVSLLPLSFYLKLGYPYNSPASSFHSAATTSLRDDRQ